MWVEFSRIKSSKLLFIAMLCGLFTGGNLFVMSFANMYDHLALHVITASMVFQVGMVWAIVSHFAIPNANQKREKVTDF